MKTPVGLSLALLLPLLAAALSAKTEKLDYLPRPVVGLTRPVEWGPGLHVLIVAGGPSPYHDHQVCNRDIDGNTLHSIGISTLYTERLSDLPAGLKDADVLLCCAAPDKSLIDAPGRKAVLDFLARGKGVIFSHEMLWVVAWKNWPEKFQLLTGRAASSHVYQAPFTVTVTAPEDPVMRGIPAHFTIDDELYRSEPVAGGTPTHVLATATEADGRTWPMVWTVQYGKARIVCIPLGHNEDAHHNEVYRQILKNAVLWVSHAPSPPWVSVFDGKDLSGWTVNCIPADRQFPFFTVDGDSIRAYAPANRRHDHIWLTTKKSYSDFDLRLEFQCVQPVGNSGIQIRCRYDEALHEMEGPQLDIHPLGPWRTGMLYDETRGTNRFLCPPGKPRDITAKLTAPGFRFYFAGEGPGWNTMEIQAMGPHILCRVNGVVTSDYYDAAGVFDDDAHREYRVGIRGPIALQIHGDYPLNMRFKDIEIQDWDPNDGPVR